MKCPTEIKQFNNGIIIDVEAAATKGMKNHSPIKHSLKQHHEQAQSRITLTAEALL